MIYTSHYKMKTQVKKSVRKKKIQTSEDGDSSYYKTSYKQISLSSTIHHCVYLNVDKEHVVDTFTPKGTRILVARYPDFYKIFLYKTHSIGEPSWPNGGVEVYNSNDETMQYFYFESVAIHPDGGNYKFNC